MHDVSSSFMTSFVWSCDWHFLALYFRDLIIEIGLTEKNYIMLIQ